MHLAEWKWWRFSPLWTRGTRTWSMTLRWISMALALPPVPGACRFQSAHSHISLLQRSVGEDFWCERRNPEPGCEPSWAWGASLAGGLGSSQVKPTTSKKECNSNVICSAMSSKGLGTFWPPAPMTEEFWYGKRIRASGQRWPSLIWMNSGHIAKSADQGVLSLNQSRAMWQQPIVTLLVELTAQYCKIECCSVFPNLFGLEGNVPCWSILYFCTNSTQIHEYTNHDSSVNSVQWAPHDFGLVRVEFRHPSCHGCF